ncbi:MAG: PCMD domain-containing protein [Bacteroidales bacterium]|nr:PCMD domain-containing protein [Bacteroidales bacterium]
MMKRMILPLLAALMTVVACMKNPLDYPLMVAEITDFEVQGQKSVSIDAANRVVTVVLEETADMKSLPVLKYAYTEDAVPSVQLPDVLDLTRPYTLSFHTYPDQAYEWTIQATQPIDRYVKCDNLIEAEFNPDKKTIVAYFPEEQPLMNIRFTKMKLEARGSQIDSTFGYVSVNGKDLATKDKMQFPITLDCVISREFKVLYKDQVTRWTFTAIHKVIELEVTSVNAWCYRADINAVFKGSGSPVIEYKESGAQEWIPLATVVSGTNITASVDQLTESTTYIARVVNGTEVSEEFPFTTETPEQLPNMSFDEWHQGNPGGYTWYPMPEGVEQVWGCANSGVNMMSAVNSTRPDYVFTAQPGGAAVRLESVKVVGMFAAGNIFTGQFVKATITGGVGAELDWGTPFKSRPKSLRGYYAYAPKVVDNASDKYKDLIGKMDKCQIMVFLTDWDEPFRVITATQQFVDLENDPGIIAMGRIESDEDTGGKYREFECVLEYRDLVRKPKYIVAVACSSLYGDYFTGGMGSVMYVDNWEFVYE